MTRRTLLWVAAPLLALLLAALVGSMIVGRSRAPSAQTRDTNLRQVYSPRVLDDPAFRKAQRRNLAALERACEERGEFCDEAAATENLLIEGGDTP